MALIIDDDDGDEVTFVANTSAPPSIIDDDEIILDDDGGASSAATGKLELSPEQLELLRTRWECKSCGEMNRGSRIKCNNCGKGRPGFESILPKSGAAKAAAEKISEAAAAAAAEASADAARAGRKRRRGWDDEDKSAKAAASAASAKAMEQMVKSWKPTVQQLRAMTIAELQPVLKAWRIHLDPKSFTRDLMLAKALKVMYNME